MLIEYITNLKNALGADAKWVFCEALDPPPSGDVCDVTTGSTALLIKGDVLDSDTVYQGGEVLVDDTGLILYVGCSAERPEELNTIVAEATKVECARGVVSPGLINAHDHLYYNHNFPFPAINWKYCGDRENTFRAVEF